MKRKITPAEKNLLEALYRVVKTGVPEEIYCGSKSSATILLNFFKILEDIGLKNKDYFLAYAGTAISCKRDDMFDGKTRLTFFHHKDSWKFEN